MVVDLERYQWNDDDWLIRRSEHQALDRPISIYEVHLGSWRKVPDEKWGRITSYNVCYTKLLRKIFPAKAYTTEIYDV